MNMIDRPSLDSIGLRYGTDKASDSHNFLRHYESFLAPLRDAPIRMLEIGVHQGASLRTWHEYFPNAQIVGMDIRPECREHAMDRATVEIGDQGDPQALLRIAAQHGPFDLIVDDGSHYWDHQILALRLLFAFIKPGGFYILEDLVTSYGIFIDSYRNSTSVSASAYLSKLVDRIVGAGADTTPDQDPFIQAYATSVESVTYYPKTAVIRRR